MRGVAALAVLWSHLVTSWKITFFAAPQDFLAVDFFFILSGFVMGAAYGERLKHGLSPAKLALIRIIRLHPLLVVGALLGTVVLLLRSGLDASPGIIESGLFAALGLPAIFLAGTLAFPINGPAWSLFFELLANFGYALIGRFLTPVRILAITLLAIVLLIVVARGNGTIEGGWQWDGLTEGSVRVFFGFMAGLALYTYRPRWKASPVVGYALLAVLTVLLFDPMHEPVVNQLVMVILVFPTMIWIGSAVRANAFFNGAGAWIGAISYPLYILHWPLIDPMRDMFLSIDPQQQFLPLWLFVQITFSVALAWVAMTMFDEPVRAFLTRRLLGRPKPLTESAKPQVSST